MSDEAVATTAIIVVLVSGAALFGVTLYYHLKAMFKRRRDRAQAQAKARLAMPNASQKNESNKDTAYTI